MKSLNTTANEDLDFVFMIIDGLPPFFYVGVSVIISFHLIVGWLVIYKSLKIQKKDQINVFHPKAILMLRKKDYLFILLLSIFTVNILLIFCSSSVLDVAIPLYKSKFVN